jgi:hypothetical protein
VTGCRNRSVSACSESRSAGAPYSLSPTMGAPSPCRCAACTRSWCVLPVSGKSSTLVLPPPRESTRHRGATAMPPSMKGSTGPHFSLHAGKYVPATRRAPETSALVEAFRRGWASVCERLRVRKEAERFLTCGDVRHGFVEVACGQCEEARLVAFSCKGRGWCPACTTRRALDTSAHLEDVLPRVAHRQWTLSLPMALRFHVVKQPILLKRLEGRLVQAVCNGAWPRPQTCAMLWARGA